MKRYTNCMEVQEDFSALLDDELTLEEREQIEGHLSGCAECLRELDALKQVDVAYSALSTVKAPEDFEEGVRQAIRPRTLRFPALGGARSSRWMGPAAAMAALLLVMFGAMFALQPWKLGLLETDRIQLADRFDEDMPTPQAEIGALSPIASRPEEVRELEEASGEAAADDKRDAQLVKFDNARENLAGEPLDAPEEKERAEGAFRAQANAPQRKAESSLAGLSAAGGLGGSGTAAPERRRVAKAPAPSSDGLPALKPKSLSNATVDPPSFERGGALQSLDTALVVTEDEALQQRAEILGDPFNEEPADVELRQAAISEQRDNYFGGRAVDGERILPESLEDLLKRDLDRMTPIKTVRVRSYRVGADGIWKEEGYDGEPTTLLKRDSKELETILALDPDIKKVVQHPARIIFQVGGKWYMLEAEAEE